MIKKKKYYAYLQAIILVIIGLSSWHSLNAAIIQSLDPVPKPWTPLTIEKTNKLITVKSWGRNYIFNNTLLPSQITSKDEQLLSSPMIVDIHKGGMQYDYETTETNITKSNGDAIEIKGRAKLQGLNTYLISNIRIEYDGLMLISLSLSSQDNWHPDSIAIKIPYNEKGMVNYLNWPESRGNTDYYGRIPLGKGIVLSNKFSPYYWIGNDSVGLFWFCESVANWPSHKKKNAIELVRDEKSIALNLNLGKTDEFTFGLQATPVKPFPDNWRKYRITNFSNKNNIKIKWIHPGEETSVKYHSWPEAEVDSIYSNVVKGIQKKGDLFFAYAAVTRVDSTLDVYRRNRNEWETGSAIMRNVEGGRSLLYIRPDSPGYADTIAQAFAYYMKKYKLDGYYLDGGGLYKYWKDKKGNQFFPILAYRKLQQKLYEAVKKVNPDALIIAHMSTNMDIPVLAYCDAYVDGEQFRGRDKRGKLAYKVQSSYLDVLSLSQFRTEFMGKQWGLIPFFLPEISKEGGNAIQPTLGLATLLLLHDVQPWVGTGNKEVWNSMYHYLDEFGFAASGTKFIPYYAKNPIAVSTEEGVYVSAYKNAKGFLLIVGNLSKQRKQGAIKLNNSIINIKDIKSSVSLTNKDQKLIKNNSMGYSIEPLSYDLIWIEK